MDDMYDLDEAELGMDIFDDLDFGDAQGGGMSMNLPMGAPPTQNQPPGRNDKQGQKKPPLKRQASSSKSNLGDSDDPLIRALGVIMQERKLSLTAIADIINVPKSSFSAWARQKHQNTETWPHRHTVDAWVRAQSETRGMAIPPATGGPGSSHGSGPSSHGGPKQPPLNKRQSSALDSFLGDISEDPNMAGFDDMDMRRASSMMGFGNPMPRGPDPSMGISGGNQPKKMTGDMRSFSSINFDDTPSNMNDLNPNMDKRYEPANFNTGPMPTGMQMKNDPNFGAAPYGRGSYSAAPPPQPVGGGYPQPGGGPPQYGMPPPGPPAYSNQYRGGPGDKPYDQHNMQQPQYPPSQRGSQSPPRSMGAGAPPPGRGPPPPQQAMREKNTANRENIEVLKTYLMELTDGSVHQRINTIVEEHCAKQRQLQQLRIPTSEFLRLSRDQSSLLIQRLQAVCGSVRVKEALLKLKASTAPGGPGGRNPSPTTQRGGPPMGPPPGQGYHQMGPPRSVGPMVNAPPGMPRHPPQMMPQQQGYPGGPGGPRPPPPGPGGAGAASQQRIPDISKYVKGWNHACKCNDDNCPDQLCKYVKPSVKHQRQVKNNQITCPPGCKHCMLYDRLCKFSMEQRKKQQQQQSQPGAPPPPGMRGQPRGYPGPGGSMAPPPGSAPPPTSQRYPPSQQAPPQQGYYDASRGMPRGAPPGNYNPNYPDPQGGGYQGGMNPNGAPPPGYAKPPPPPRGMQDPNANPGQYYGGRDQSGGYGGPGGGNPNDYYDQRGPPPGNYQGYGGGPNTGNDQKYTPGYGGPNQPPGGYGSQPPPPKMTRGASGYGSQQPPPGGGNIPKGGNYQSGPPPGMYRNPSGSDNFDGYGYPKYNNGPGGSGNSNNSPNYPPAGPPQPRPMPPPQQGYGNYPPPNNSAQGQYAQQQQPPPQPKPYGSNYPPPQSQQASLPPMQKVPSKQSTNKAHSGSGGPPHGSHHQPPPPQQQQRYNNYPPDSQPPSNGQYYNSNSNTGSYAPPPNNSSGPPPPPHQQQQQHQNPPSSSMPQRTQHQRSASSGSGSHSHSSAAPNTEPMGDNSNIPGRSSSADIGDSSAQHQSNSGSGMSNNDAGGPPVTPQHQMGGPPMTPQHQMGGPPMTPQHQMGGPPMTPQHQMGGPPPTPQHQVGGPPPTPQHSSVGGGQEDLNREHSSDSYGSGKQRATEDLSEQSDAKRRKTDDSFWGDESNNQTDGDNRPVKEVYEGESTSEVIVSEEVKNENEGGDDDPMKVADGEEPDRKSSSGVEQLLCVICQDADRDLLFGPCHHICTCAKCGNNQTVINCPICRGPIETKKPIFLS